MDTKTKSELIVLCKEKKIKGYSGKKREEILALLASSSSQDTGKKRTNMKDQFYTRSSVAEKCVQTILSVLPNARGYTWIEPSAGSGAFLHNVPSTVTAIGVDIEPKSADILTGDFLSWTPPSPPTQCIVFGNPPFGRQGSLAKAFIRKACQFSEAIAFILPRSFQKPSMANVFDSMFRCIHSEELDKNSFEINGVAHDVPCVFQIWQKHATPRTDPPKIQATGFRYVRADEPYDIAFRRVGGLAGRCYAFGGIFSPQSHYFWKLDEAFVARIPAILARINAHVFPSNTVGPRSLSKTEANQVMNAILESL